MSERVLLTGGAGYIASFCIEVRSEIDTNIHQVGVKVTDDEVDAVNIPPHRFHGD